MKNSLFISQIHATNRLGFWRHGVAGVVMGLLLALGATAASAITMQASPRVVGANVNTSMADLAVATAPATGIQNPSGTLVYVYSAVPAGETRRRIFLTVESGPGTNVFFPPVKISSGRSDGAGDDMNPTVAISPSGAIHVAWTGLGSNNRRQVYYALVNTSGVLQKGPLVLTSLGADASQPQIALAPFGGTLFLPYIAFRGPSTTSVPQPGYDILLLTPNINTFTGFNTTLFNVSNTLGSDGVQNPTISLDYNSLSGAVVGAVAWDNGAGNILTAWVSGSVNSPATLIFTLPEVVVPLSSGDSTRGRQPALAIQPMPASSQVGHLAFNRTDGQGGGVDVVGYLQFSPYASSSGLRKELFSLSQPLQVPPCGRPGIVVEPGTLQGSVPYSRRVSITAYQPMQNNIFITRNNGGISSLFGFPTNPSGITQFLDSAFLRPRILFGGSVLAAGPQMIALTNITTAYAVRVGYLDIASTVDYVLGNETGLADPTPSPTPTPTASPTGVASPSPTASPSPSPSAVVSPTPSPTPTPSQTPTLTMEPSPTMPPTASPTPSLTPTQSLTPTPSRTPMPSPSLTESPTPSPTPTLSPTPSLSSSPTPTFVYREELRDGLLGIGPPLDPARRPDVNGDGVSDIADLILLILEGR